MRTDLTRKNFLMIGLGAVAATAFDCAADDSTTPGGGAGSTGNAGNGSAGSGTGQSGSNTSSGGSAGTSTTSGAGGDGTSSGGSSGSGGGNSNVDASVGSGGSSAGAAGSGGGASCTKDITSLSSMSAGTMAHQHRLVIPMADIMAGAAKIFETDTSPGAPGCSHCHEIPLTAADITMLKSGGVVKKQTCAGGDHEFVLSCVAGAPDPVAPTAARCPTNSMEGACTSNNKCP